MFTAFHPPSHAGAMLDQGLCANLLDAVAEAPSAEAALVRVDAYRRLLAGPGIFSIQLNVTTREDPCNVLVGGPGLPRAGLQAQDTDTLDRDPVPEG
jgi:hypothetical protein